MSTTCCVRWELPLSIPRNRVATTFGEESPRPEEAEQKPARGNGRKEERTEEFRPQLRGCADDLVFFAESLQELKKAIEETAATCEKLGLKINYGKTHYQGFEKNSKKMPKQMEKSSPR